jgi:ABC-2 type transport system ATP-binding protein
MTGNALVVTHVSFTYGRSESLAVHDVSFTAEPGDIVGVRGENGAGKSTLLNLVGGLYRPDEGTVIFDGLPIENQRRRVAWVAAEFDMFPYLSIEENVRFFLEFYGASYGDQDLEHLLQRYRLFDDRSKPAQSASRGMRRKTQIVTAFLQAPALLLADEPLDGLDEDAQAVFLADLKDFARGGGIVMIALHSQEREEEVATKRLLIRSARASAADPAVVK